MYLTPISIFSTALLIFLWLLHLKHSYSFCLQSIFGENTYFFPEFSADLSLPQQCRGSNDSAGARCTGVYTLKLNDKQMSVNELRVTELQLLPLLMDGWRG